MGARAPPREGPTGLGVGSRGWRGPSTLPCPQLPSSWKGMVMVVAGVPPDLQGCFDAQEILYFCENISVSLWKLIQLFKVT